MMDLHTHTFYSDGSDSPGEIVRMAKAKGLDLCAVSDHDCIDGLPEALAEGRAIGMPVLTGIEFDVENECELHLLGYGFDPENPALKSELSRQLIEREQRNGLIVEKLESMGIPLSVKRDSRGTLVSRTHLADAIVRAGKAETIQEAFDRYLGPGGSVRFDRKRMQPREAISLIHEAGGLAVVAHPGLIRMRGEETLESLVEWGLDGIEAYYPRHTAHQIVFFCQMAMAKGLLITTGSDYHGAFRKNAKFAYIAELANREPRVQGTQARLLEMTQIW